VYEEFDDSGRSESVWLFWFVWLVWLSIWLKNRWFNIFFGNFSILNEAL
jgi:hypothetical protein